MTPQISVIMPAYNLEKYIRPSIASVLSQTFTGWELIVVDDCSTDGTAGIVNEMVQNDSRIKLIRLERNSGVSCARNKGIAEAYGQFIAFLDGDDLWEPDFLEKMLERQIKTEFPIVYCGHDRLIGEMIEYKEEVPCREGHLLLYGAENRGMFFIAAMLISLDFLRSNDIYFTEGCPVGEDVEFIYKLFCHGQVAAVDKNLVHYRKRLGSTMESAWNWEKSIHYVTSLERTYDYILENYNRPDKEAVEKALQRQIDESRCRFLWRLIQHGYYKKAAEFKKNNAWQQSLASYVQYARKSKSVEVAIINSDNRWLWKFVKLVSDMGIVRK